MLNSYLLLSFLSHFEVGFFFRFLTKCKLLVQTHFLCCLLSCLVLQLSLTCDLKNYCTMFHLLFFALTFSTYFPFSYVIISAFFIFLYRFIHDHDFLIVKHIRCLNDNWKLIFFSPQCDTRWGLLYTINISHIVDKCKQTLEKKAQKNTKIKTAV